MLDLTLVMSGNTVGLLTSGYHLLGLIGATSEINRVSSVYNNLYICTSKVHCASQKSLKGMLLLMVTIKWCLTFGSYRFYYKNVLQPI